MHLSSKHFGNAHLHSCVRSVKHKLKLKERVHYTGTFLSLVIFILFYFVLLSNLSKCTLHYNLLYFPSLLILTLYNPLAIF